ncbi:MAG: endonuclease MutS2 [Fimbriimonas sp.]
MHALRVLEFEEVRQRLVRHCETEMAAALASAVAPHWAPDLVWSELNRTGEADAMLGTGSPPSLGPVHDQRDQVQRAAKGGVLGAVEAYQIGESLVAMRTFRAFLHNRREALPLLWPIAEALCENRKLEDRIMATFEPDGSFKSDASPALAVLRQKKKAAQARIIERIQSYVNGRHREHLSDPIYTVRDGRYVVPLKAEHKGKIRGIIHDTSASGQTIYVEPEDVLNLGNNLREIEGAEREEQVRILTALSAQIGTHGREIRDGIVAAGELDFVFAKARLGDAMRAVLPTPVSGHRLVVEFGRHPLIEREKAVPLTIDVGSGNNVLITGPNTGGKTVAIKTVGLFVLMAQCGLMLPASEVRLGPFTQVWADIGDEQSLQQSLSTFSGHIKNIGEAITNLKPGALVLLDEVGAGTDPAEGAALAQSILVELVDRGATLLASTHYGELKAFAYSQPGFVNAAMEFDPKTFRPSYRLLMGAPGASHALKIAERYGIPLPVVERAKENLGTQALDVARMIEQLELAQRRARIAQGEADRRTAELKRMEEQSRAKLAEAEDIRRNAQARASETIEAALREIRLEAEELFESLKRSADGRKVEEVRKGLKELQEVGQSFAKEIAPKERKTEPSSKPLERGMQVRIAGYTQVGTILEDPVGKLVAVQIGPLKMTIPVRNLSLVDRVVHDKPKTNIRLARAMTAGTELHLRNMRAEDAERDLEKFVDESVLSGVPFIRIVHGKGEGILRKITQDYLRRHPAVGQYRDGEPAEGGQGVTIATFK